MIQLQNYELVKNTIGHVYIGAKKLPGQCGKIFLKFFSLFNAKSLFVCFIKYANYMYAFTLCCFSSDNDVQ